MTELLCTADAIKAPRSPAMTLSEPQLPAHDDMRTIFGLVFESLDETVQERIRDWWAGLGSSDARIETNPERFEDDVDYVLIIGNVVMFRRDRIADRRHSVIALIYHELAHCFLAASGAHLPLDYHRIRSRYESGAIKMTKRLMEDLKRSPSRKKLLGSNKLIAQWSGVFDFAPVAVDERLGRLAQRT